MVEVNKAFHHLQLLNPTVELLCGEWGDDVRYGVVIYCINGMDLRGDDGVVFCGLLCFFVHLIHFLVIIAQDEFVILLWGVMREGGIFICKSHIFLVLLLLLLLLVDDAFCTTIKVFSESFCCCYIIRCEGIIMHDAGCLLLLLLCGPFWAV